MAEGSILPGLPAPALSIESIIGRGPNSTIYAVNEHTIFKQFHSFEGAPLLLAELSACNQIDGFQHPNLTHIHGYVQEPPIFGLMMERMDCNLEQFLQANPQLTSADKCHIALSVARGLQFLHGHSKDGILLHRNIKPTNILLKGDRVAISDFSRSASLQNWESAHSLVGDTCYQAPEVILQEMREESDVEEENAKMPGYTLPADVFSFGMLLYEILTLHKPFFSLETNRMPSSLHIARRTSRGTRPDLNRIPTPSEEDVLEWRLLLVMQLCWYQNPIGRPSMDDVVQWLENATIQELQGALEHQHATFHPSVPTSY